MIEFQQNVLGYLQAKLPAGADIRNRLDLGPSSPARFAKGRLAEGPPDQESLGLRQPAGLWANSRISDARALQSSPRCLLSECRHEKWMYRSPALGYLVELDQLARPRQRYDDPGNDLRARGHMIFPPAVERFNEYRAAVRPCRPARARPRRSTGSTANRRPASRVRYFRPACRRSGSEASRTAR